MSKRKLLKIIFHSFILASILLPMFYFVDQLPENAVYFQRTVYFSLLLIPFYAFNTFYLVREFLKKGKYTAFIVSVILSMVAFGFSVNFLIYNNAREKKSSESASINTQNQIPPDVKKDANIQSKQANGYQLRRPRLRTRRSRYPFFMLPLLMITALGTSFEIILEWDQQRRRNKEAEMERISAELLFLKSQLNPHFIFNTLNNIYSLAAIKSDDTEKAILLLSSMMRYILYESGADKIPIRKEIQLIEDYMALQKMRFPGQRNIHIQFEHDPSLQNLLIEPMLFLPLIENAFKHGISYHEKSSIYISLYRLENQLILDVENTIPSAKSIQNTDNPSGGIGLSNIRKRLHLSYPNNHKLIIQESDNLFQTHLSLNLIPL